MHCPTFSPPQGSCVCVKKSLFHSLELVEALPFPLAMRGYVFPSALFPLKAWVKPWFGMSYLRPGVMIVRCISRADGVSTELIIANVHLVTGVTNPTRLKQVAFVQAAIERAVEQFGCHHVLLCGDFNAHHDQVWSRCRQYPLVLACCPRWAESFLLFAQ